AHALAVGAQELGLAPWTVELRTGDTSSSVKARQKNRLPSALVTTPESLSLLLTYTHARELFAELDAVVVDEWHELLSTKRGTQTELALARLRAFRPGLRTWGLSATLDNLDDAMRTMLGDLPTGPTRGRIIHADVAKRIDIETILPDDATRFPWAGHLGVKLLPKVVDAIAAAKSTLLFTNTRSQAELWHRALQTTKPDWADDIALHHGSLDREVRDDVERRLHEGALRCCVATSSLDLGVDFSPVDQVIQVGSPKGVARLLQRAGRSGHRPGERSIIKCVPTHALELVEFAAARDAATARDVEARRPLDRPLDVLVQHLVTIALGEGFADDAMLAEVRSTRAFHNLTDDEWSWCLDFVTRGGPSLRVYDQYRKVVDVDGVRRVTNQRIARNHRMSVGTITADTAVAVKYQSGATLGTVEESFAARLRKGDVFLFAGKHLEFIRLRDMTLHVRRATKKSTFVPRWGGGRLPLSTQLAAHTRDRLDRWTSTDCPEMAAVQPLLRVQASWSVLPARDELLIERAQSRDGHHFFLYPFAGRLAHEGLAALVAYRLARDTPRSVTMTVNDYGFELLTPEPVDLTEADWHALLSTDRLVEDLLESLNASEMARRQFREVARVAGLILVGFPGAGKSARQLQASSELLFDVFSDYDPANLLLDQARREVLERQLEVTRIRAALERLAESRIAAVDLDRLTPFSFPLWADRLQSELTTERWTDRVQKMAVYLEEEASPTRTKSRPVPIESNAPRPKGLSSSATHKSSAARPRRSRPRI
ncbi:MAG: ligase-associated DNA damage response DEXH box helicase, partial [Phycisphaerales bacterium]